MIIKVNEFFAEQVNNNNRNRPYFDEGPTDDYSGSPLPTETIPRPPNGEIRIINSHQPPLFNLNKLNATTAVACFPERKAEDPIIRRELDETNIVPALARIYGNIASKIKSFHNPEKPEKGFRRTKAYKVLKSLIKEGKAQNIIKPLEDKFKELIIAMRFAIPSFDEYFEEINFGPTSFEKHTALFTPEVNTNMLTTAKKVNITTEEDSRELTEHQQQLKDLFLAEAGDNLATIRTWNHWLNSGHQYPIANRWDQMLALGQLLRTRSHMETIGKIENYELTARKDYLQAASVRPDLFKIRAKEGLNPEESYRAQQLVAQFNEVMEGYKVGTYIIPQKMQAAAFATFAEIVSNLGSLLTLDYFEVKTALTYNEARVINGRELAEKYASETLTTGILTLFNLYKYSDRKQSIPEFIRSIIENGGIDPKVLVASCPLFRRGRRLNDITPEEISEESFKIELFDVNTLLGADYESILNDKITRLEENIKHKQKVRCIARLLKIHFENIPDASEDDVIKRRHELLRYSMDELLIMLRKIESAGNLTPITSGYLGIPFTSFGSILNPPGQPISQSEQSPNLEEGNGLFIPITVKLIDYGIYTNEQQEVLVPRRFEH